MPVIDLGQVVGPEGPRGLTGLTGSEGPEGPAGPNQITTNTSTPLGADAAPVVFTGNGSKVGSKAIDAKPTYNSQGVALSGGIFSMLPRVLGDSGIVGVTITAGTTWEIAPAASGNQRYAALIVTVGANNEPTQASVTFIAGSSNGTGGNYRRIETLVAGGAVTVAASTNGFTVSASTGLYCTVIALCDVGHSLTFAEVSA